MLKLKILVLLLIFTLVNTNGQDTIKIQNVPDAKPAEFKYIGYWFSRGTASNIAPTNELLRGQIIGRLFGPNTTNTSAKTSSFFEQRFVPMFIYTPQILDGVATFRSLFKIDMTWGDAAYGVGGNTGGGINAGQVNLQTLLANVDIKPRNSEWNVVVGLQRIFDNARDPNQIAVSTAQTSAYKLSYWGTQGVGISLFANLSNSTIGRLGYYQLYENLINENDDVALWMLDVESKLTPRLEVGADFWMVWDRGKNAGGITVLNQGLNSTLAEYNGAVRLSFPTSKYEANLYWAGAHAAYNRDFLSGRFWADGYAMMNFGTIDTVNQNTLDAKQYATNMGLALNAMVAYKYGKTALDKVSFEAMYTSGDEDGALDKELNSVLTGNEWGAPTGIYSSHKALLLFPDPQVVNRYYSAVHDISNMGLGVTAAFFSFSKDIIPNLFNGKIGLAHAVSNYALPSGGKELGTEVNMEFKYNIKVFLTVGLSAGYLWLGDFYDSPKSTYANASSKPKNPFVIFTSLSWLMF